LDNFAVIIPAAGQGKRMKSAQHKQFIFLQGMPIIVHTLRVFQAVEEVGEIIIVCAPGEEEYYQNEISRDEYLLKRTIVVTGGKERQDSVNCGLKAVSTECKYIMVHDGVRPLITHDIISRLIEGVKACGAVIAGVPVKDTIKRADANGIIIETPRREGLWQVQTPQIFSAQLLKLAYEKADETDFYGTDDASLVERLGVAVQMMMGSYENIKITTSDDLIIAEAILQRRSGG
jgi:2-C-methyl-D-erythritol 4-phosphate cytidylyltransferase